MKELCPYAGWMLAIKPKLCFRGNNYCAAHFACVFGGLEVPSCLRMTSVSMARSFTPLRGEGLRRRGRGAAIYGREKSGFEGFFEGSPQGSKL